MSSDDDRMIFEAALRANEDDEMTRLVFADWLDEHGEPEEATRHRQWKGSKEWLLKFHESFYPLGDDEDACDGYMPFETMIETAETTLSSRGVEECDFGRAESLMYGVLESPDFWRHASIVTGVPLSEDLEGFRRRLSFHCAC